MVLAAKVTHQYVFKSLSLLFGDALNISLDITGVLHLFLRESPKTY